MITCVVDYTIDPAEIASFEAFARRWIELVYQHGGTHHGYFLPAEGASDKALALFTFPSLAAYEEYRTRFGVDPTSSRPTRSATTATASFGTSGRSCGRCCLKTSAGSSRGAPERQLTGRSRNAVPRLISSLAMMTRWISEVPSQIRSTRTSRYIRSIG